MNCFVNVAYDSVGETEEMAEEAIIAGPTYANANLDFAVEAAFSKKDQEGDLPVLVIYTFKNFYAFEGLAMTSDYSSQPEKSGFLIMEGVTVFVAGVEKVFSTKFNKNLWVVHLLNE